MATIYKQITLNAEGGLAGPNYAVYYSYDCLNYTASISSPVSLPNIGSTALIAIPDTTQCVKLVNLSVDCNENEVIKVINLTTTTTTTSTSTTTTSTSTTTTSTSTTTTSTSTTTTAAPTTTTTSTTTLAPGYFRALDCSDNVTHIYSTLTAAGTFNSGDRITANGGLPYVVDGFQTSNPGGTLYAFTATGQFGCPATTTTSTTTIPPLTVTNGTVTCSGITGAWRSSFTGGSGTYTNVAYADSQANAIDWLDGSGSGTGAMHTLSPGDTYYDWSGIDNGTWYVALKDSLGNTTVQNTAVVVSCTTTTTTSTSTTTTSTSTTTTTLAPLYYRALDCADNVTHIYSTLQPAGTFNSGDRITANGGTYVIDGSQTNNPGGTLYTFTATGQTGCPATTTTTTTTLAPLSVTNGSVTCSGTTGAFRASFSGGTGTYNYVAIADSQANAATCVAGGACGTGGFRVTLGAGDTYYDFSSIANGTWYTAVRDSLPQTSVQNTGVSVNCTTTTTTTTTTAAPTTTTTTTTAAPTTTTTTTLPNYAYVQIFNDTSNATITGVAVEGVAIDAAFFPLSPGDNTSGTTTNIGASQTVTITYTDASGNYVEIFDTDSNQNCAVATGTGKTFNGQVISALGTVTITMGDGSCP